MAAKHIKHIRRQRQSRQRIRIVVLSIIILVCLYMLGQYLCDWEWLTETVATILAIIAAVAFWLEYHENKLLNEAQFIMELNEQFLCDSNLSDFDTKDSFHPGKKGNWEIIAPVTIGDDVWIGTGSIILPGITIGSGFTIGAGSVVTHDIPPMCLHMVCRVKLSKKERNEGWCKNRWTQKKA